MVNSPCPNQSIVDKVAHDMYYAEDSVTVRLSRGEGRMDRLENDQAKQNTKQNWMLGLLVTTLIAIIVNLVTKH